MLYVPVTLPKGDPEQFYEPSSAAELPEELVPVQRAGTPDEVMRQARKLYNHVGGLDELRSALKLRALNEQAMANGINPHVRRMIEFLHRRNSGRHGRYLEGQRKDQRASIVTPPTSTSTQIGDPVMTLLTSARSVSRSSKGSLGGSLTGSLCHGVRRNSCAFSLHV